MAEPVLLGRYELGRVLGEGGFATTFLAEDRQEGGSCVVKRVSLRAALATGDTRVGSLTGADAVKLTELIERERRVLSQLRHPAIPRFIDAFSVQREDDLELYLVQEHVPGVDLARQVVAGRRFDERAVVGIGLELAQVLEYLHGLAPPIIHRDIKPSNIVLREDGKVFLVDFGAVKDRIDRSALDEATVVGTFGYMPLEQFEGRALPASDLYSLGVTLVFLLSHRSPAEIPRRAMRLDFRSCVRVSPGLATVLDRLLQPDPEARYKSATALRRELERLIAGPRPGAAASPAGRRILVGAVLAAAGLAAIGTRDRRPPPDRAETAARESAVRPPPPLPTARAREPADAARVFPVSLGPGYVHGLLLERQGTVWQAGADGVGRFDRALRKPEMLLTRDHPLWSPGSAAGRGGRHFFPVLMASDRSSLWIADRDGRVLKLDSGEWQPVPEPAGWRSDDWIGRLEVYRGRLHAGTSHGLLALDPERGWQRAEGARWPSVSALQVTQSGALLVSSGSEVWRIEPGSRKRLWAGARAREDVVTGLHDLDDGRVLVGTHDGFVVLSGAGEVIGRELLGKRITAFAGGSAGGLWVGTGEHGLFHQQGALWYRYAYPEGLPSDGVQALLIDRRGRLWCASGDRLLVGPADEVAEKMMRLPRPGTRSGAEFDHAGWAAEALLGVREESGEVAWRRAGGRTLVFFAGRLVHPDGHRHDAPLRGYRRRDGAIGLVTADWKAEIWRSEQVERHPASPDAPGPPPRVRVYPRDVLFDRSDRLWAGAGRFGWIRLERGAWVKEPDRDLQIGVLAEDARGVIWAGGDNVTGQTLHRFDQTGWRHFVCARRQYVRYSQNVLALSPLRDGRLALTTLDQLVWFPSDAEPDCTTTSLPVDRRDWLTEDPKGRLWLTGPSTRGIAWLEAGKLRQTTSREGLFSDWIVAHAVDGNDRIWLLARDGRVGIYPIGLFTTP